MIDSDIRETLLALTDALDDVGNGVDAGDELATSAALEHALTILDNLVDELEAR